MLGYRSTFTVADPRDSVVDRVRGIMVRWSEAKHGEVLGPHGLDDLVPGSRVSPAPSLEFFLVDTTEESGDRIMGFVCVESNGRDAWTSQVMVAGPEEGGRTVIAVDIDAQSASTEPSRPTTMGVPRFVRNMLEEFDCDDNGITLSNDPRVLHAEDVDTLIIQGSDVTVYARDIDHLQIQGSNVTVHWLGDDPDIQDLGANNTTGRLTQ